MTTKEIEAELASICDNYKNPDLGLGSLDVDRLYNLIKELQKKNEDLKVQVVNATIFTSRNAEQLIRALESDLSTSQAENKKLREALDAAVRNNSDRNEVENER